MSADASDLRKFATDLTKAPSRAQAAARSAVAKTAADISRDAKILAPVDTGNLRNSIGYDLRHERDGSEAEIGPTANYGIYLEYGTSVMAAQPYLGPAFDRRIPGFEKAMEQLGGDAIG